METYETTARTPFVWVRDKAGNELVRPRDALMDPGAQP